MPLLDQSQLKSEVKALSLTQSLTDAQGDVERDGKGTWKDIQYGVPLLSLASKMFIL